MKISTKALLTGAAMAGLMAGVAPRTQAYVTPTGSQQISSLTAVSGFGLLDDSTDKGKHDCKGKNDCKGLGGCKTDKNDCKGKNACKGAGGCNTSK